MPMKLRRLCQPRNALFWLVVVLNLLSMVLGWITQTLLLGGFDSGVMGRLVKC